MKIGLRAGHSPNCKGAMGYLDEQVEVRKIYDELAIMLRAAKHTVIDCNSSANNVYAELADGTNKANNNNCDIFVSIHMNASGGAGEGVECWLYDTASDLTDIAKTICKNYAEKGFRNRGLKYSTGLHDLNASNMTAMIIETLFCDNEHDANLYKEIGPKGAASLIANAIAGTSITTGGTPATAPIPKEDGHNAHLYANNGNRNQKWVIEPDGEYVRFKCKATGEYLDTAGPAKSGINIKTYKKSSSAGQLFKIVPIEDKGSNTECYKILSKANAKLAVDVYGSGIANGTNIQLYADNGTKAQQWFFRKDADGYMIFNAFSLKALDGGGSL